jgi:Protein of unknown function (DUF2840)
MIATRFHRDTLTHIELIWHEQQIEHWIRFGRDVAEKILDRRRRILSFAANSIVAYVRWASGDFGTIASRIDILHTVRRGEAFSTVPYVRPGGEILLRVSGWPKMQRVPSNRSASTRQTPVLITGTIFITGWPSAKRHGLTAASSIGHGCCARRSTHDVPCNDHDDQRGGGLRGDDVAAPACFEADLECQRQRADRALCGEANQCPSHR